MAFSQYPVSGSNTGSDARWQLAHTPAPRWTHLPPPRRQLSAAKAVDRLLNAFERHWRVL